MSYRLPLIVAIVLVLLCGTLLAQSGQLTRVGTWKPPREHTLVEFQNKLWSIGGITMLNHVMDEVWSSPDGATWTREVTGAPFGPRFGHTTVVFNNRIWVMGGARDWGTNLHDVWSSPDGVNWSLVTPAAAWVPRTEHASAVFDNRMWVFGGRGSGFFGDVWSSVNGATWNLEAQSPFSPRYGHTAAAYNGSLYVMGGSGEQSDVWASTDGINWTLQNGNAWPGRSGHASVEFDGKLWVIGGGWAFGRDCRYTTDGVNWQVATLNAQWLGRRDHAVAVFSSRVWVMGGFFEANDSVWSLRRDIWSSVNGASWQFVFKDSNWQPRSDHGVVTFSNRLWIVGGWKIHAPGAGVSNDSNEVWSSDNGKDWTLECVAPFVPRAGHGMVVHDGRMWVIGGMTDGWQSLNDTWSSIDGVNWVQHSATAPWTPRERHSVLAFDNRLWVLGGMYSDFIICQRDVWSSPDGVTWTQHAAPAPWQARSDATAYVAGNRMWLGGGQGTYLGQYYTDLWSSDDGTNWTQESASAPFLPRVSQGVASIGGSLVLCGYQTALGAIWTSQDGLNWSQVSTNQPWYPMDQIWKAGITAHNGKVCIMGGGTSFEHCNDVWTFEFDTPPAFTSTPLTTVATGQVYTYHITATGVPAPTITASGLPTWLTLHGNTLTGTPTPADAGQTGVIQLTATNSTGSNLQAFQISVQSGAMITSTPPTAAIAGQPYTYQFTVAGVQPITTSVTGLPAWLSVSGDTISGVPSESDIGVSQTISITASNPYGGDMQDFVINVQGQPPVFMSLPVTSATVGIRYSYMVTAIGIPAPQITATTLPSWLQFDPVTGELHGVPPTSSMDTPATVQLTATNGWGTDAVQSFSISVQDVVSRSDNTGAGCTTGAGFAPVALLLALLRRRRRK